MSFQDQEAKTLLKRHYIEQSRGSDGIDWESDDVRGQAFADAQQFFAENPGELKLSRKLQPSMGRPLPVSFLNFGGQVVAVNSITNSPYGKTHPAFSARSSMHGTGVGEGDVAKAKAAYYRAGGGFSRFKCGETKSGEVIGVLITERPCGKKYRIIKNFGLDAFLSDERKFLRGDGKILFVYLSFLCVKSFHDRYGAVFGDVKDENIMLKFAQNGAIDHAVLIDEPPVKKQLDTMFDRSVGEACWDRTSDFLAPEVNRKRFFVTEKIDVFSLGIMALWAVREKIGISPPQFNSRHPGGQKVALHKYYKALTDHVDCRSQHRLQAMESLFLRMISADLMRRPALSDCIVELESMFPNLKNTQARADHQSGLPASAGRECETIFRPAQAVGQDDVAQELLTPQQASKKLCAINAKFGVAATVGVGFMAASAVAFGMLAAAGAVTATGAGLVPGFMLALLGVIILASALLYRCSLVRDQVVELEESCRGGSVTQSC